MRLRFIAAAVTALCLHLSSTSESQDLQIQRGDDLLAHGDFAAAEQLFRELFEGTRGTAFIVPNLGYRSCVRSYTRRPKASSRRC